MKELLDLQQSPTCGLETLRSVDVGVSPRCFHQYVTKQSVSQIQGLCYQAGLDRCVSSETVSVLKVSESMCVLRDSVCPYSQCVSSKSVRQCLSSESVCVLRDRETVCVLRDSMCPQRQCVSFSVSPETVCVLQRQ